MSVIRTMPHLTPARHLFMRVRPLMIMQCGRRKEADECPGVCEGAVTDVGTHDKTVVKKRQSECLDEEPWADKKKRDEKLFDRSTLAVRRQHQRAERERLTDGGVGIIDGSWDKESMRRRCGRGTDRCQVETQTLAFCSKIENVVSAFTTLVFLVQWGEWETGRDCTSCPKCYHRRTALDSIVLIIDYLAWWEGSERIMLEGIYIDQFSLTVSPLSQCCPRFGPNVYEEQHILGKRYTA